MEIVIKIPNEYAKQFYENKCKDKFDNLATNEFGYVLRKAFEKCTPLPKGHGRIIDESKITSVYYHQETSYENTVYHCHTVIDGTDAPTIIEGSESE